uniref:Cathepsin propeptide inhibitor domain-containing protein n=1 Tax=Setaria italica TaxID=4555 RepID=K3YML5_SETIT
EEEEEDDKDYFEAEEKDLESDEALWALYERWCKAFNQERSLDEMARRFSKFKETVLSVESNKKARLPYRFEINKFADGKMAELVSPKWFPTEFHS